MTRRIVIAAGEASGDAHGGRLAAALKRRAPGVELIGMGGPAMRAAGVDIVVDCGELSVMGFSELGGGLGRVLRAYRAMRRLLGEGDGLAGFIPIDFPDFNLRLCRYAHARGIRVVYYVGPQVWAWRPRRIETIRRCVDRMLCLFPFEEELYRRHGVDAHFVGHPLAEAVSPTRARISVRKDLGISDDDRALIALLPGSRAKEIQFNLPPMLAAACRMADRADFAIALAPAIPEPVVARYLAERHLRIPIVREQTYNLLSAADVAVVVSGTATVEAAVLGCPMVVVYRMSRFSYAIARRLVRVPFIAMPNLILRERVIPELVQGDATGERISAECVRYLDDPSARRAVRERLAEVRRALARPGAAERAADLALEKLA